METGLENWIALERNLLVQMIENLKTEKAHHDGIYVSDSQTAVAEALEDLLERGVSLKSLLDKVIK